MKAVESYGTNWAQVARSVGSRNSDQCSSHWNQVLNPAINFSDWTDIEVRAAKTLLRCPRSAFIDSGPQDAELLQSVLTHGTNWTTIAASHKPSRTTLALKNRYSALRSKYEWSKTHPNSRPPSQSYAISQVAQSHRNTAMQTPPGEEDEEDEDEEDEDCSESPGDSCDAMVDGASPSQDLMPDVRAGAREPPQLRIVSPLQNTHFDDHSRFLFPLDVMSTPGIGGDKGSQTPSEQLAEQFHTINRLQMHGQNHQDRMAEQDLVASSGERMMATSCKDEPLHPRTVQNMAQGLTEDFIADTMHFAFSGTMGLPNSPQPGEWMAETEPSLAHSTATSEMTSSIGATSISLNSNSGLPDDPSRLYEVSINVMCTGTQLPSVLRLADVGTGLTLKISPKN